MKYLNHSGTTLNLSHFMITNVGGVVYTNRQLLSARNMRPAIQLSRLIVPNTSDHIEVVYFYLNPCTICTSGDFEAY